MAHMILLNVKCPGLGNGGGRCILADARASFAWIISSTCGIIIHNAQACNQS